MKVQFDLHSRPEFLSSLDDLGDEVPDLVFDELDAISQSKDWERFRIEHSWTSRPVEPIDSYPGAPDYYSFTVLLADARTVKIVGFLNRAAEVFCAVAVSIT